MIDRSKASKMACLSTDNWKVIVEYLQRTKVPLRRATEATEVLKVMSEVKWLDVVIQEANE